MRVFNRSFPPVFDRGSITEFQRDVCWNAPERRTRRTPRHVKGLIWRSALMASRKVVEVASRVSYGRMLSRSFKLRWWWWWWRFYWESIIVIQVGGLWAKIIGSGGKLVVLMGLGDSTMMIRPRMIKRNLIATWLWIFKRAGTATVRIFMIRAS